jgi:hypothetical protein
MEKNFNRPFFPLPYRSGDDRPPTLPLAPRNVNITSPFLIGIVDVRWDDPSVYAENNRFNILGVNVYKSYDSSEGPFTKINTDPIGISFYRDQTQETTVTEDPTQGGRFIAGTTATRDWIAKSYNKPIVIPGTNGQLADNWTHVMVQIKRTSADQFVVVPAFKVKGETGEIYLISSQVYNNTTNRLEEPVLPYLDRGGEIRITYTYIPPSSYIQTDLHRRIYYKVTTVGIDASCDSGIMETPLNEVEAFNPYDMEKIDWIWAESIRRNRWILEQGGERVKLFIRKWSGVRCPCWNEQFRQSKQDDLQCYGVGYIGGYQGPLDIIIAPPEGEKIVNLFDIGLRVTYDWPSWTGPYPLLSDRDFIVRQNNDRFSLAHINPQGSRGAIYQQHFQLHQLEQGDIRYQVPITGGAVSVPPAWNAFREPKPTDASPVINDKPTVPEQYQYKGRSVTFENIVM